MSLDEEEVTFTRKADASLADVKNPAAIYRPVSSSEWRVSGRET